MAEYILVAEEEGEEPMEIPVEDDGTLLLSTLSAQFPGSCGLRFRNPESGAFRGVRVHEGRLHPPETQNDVPFVAVFPKCNPDAIIDNKRKGDQVLDNPTPKTKKLENIKCTDLIVLGLDYKTTEETMREYFSVFGRTVLCEIKKRQDNAQSRGFGFIKFTDYNMQRRVLGQRHEIDGRMCDVKIPASKETDEQSRRVFIGRVPETMKSDELRNYFKNYGEVTEVFIPKPFRPFAFVTFEDPEVAQSLCGEDHSINDTSLLVRSAAPRQDTDIMMTDDQARVARSLLPRVKPDVGQHESFLCNHMTDLNDKNRRMLKPFKASHRKHHNQTVVTSQPLSSGIINMDVVTTLASELCQNEQSVHLIDGSVHLSNLDNAKFETFVESNVYTEPDQSDHSELPDTMRPCSVSLSDIVHADTNHPSLHSLTNANSTLCDEQLVLKQCSVELSHLDKDVCCALSKHGLKPCSVVLTLDEELNGVLLKNKDSVYTKPCSVLLTDLLNETNKSQFEQDINLKSCSVVLSDLLKCNISKSKHVILRPCSVVLSDFIARNYTPQFDQHGVLKPCSVVLYDCLINNPHLIKCYVILDDCMTSTGDAAVAELTHVGEAYSIQSGLPNVTRHETVQQIATNELSSSTQMSVSSAPLPTVIEQVSHIQPPNTTDREPSVQSSSITYQSTTQHPTLQPFRVVLIDYGHRMRLHET